MCKNNNRIPPKTHNLLVLADKSSLNLSNDQEIFLGEINGFNIEARYPRYKQEFYKLCSKNFTSDYFFKIKELFTWIKSQLV